MHDVVNILKADIWSVAKGRREGLPIVIRSRSELSRQTDVSGFPQRVQVCWRFDANDAGLPSKAAVDAMDLFEDRLVLDLEAKVAGILVAVVTSNGEREWVLYCADIEAFSKQLHAMPQESGPYPVHISTAVDSNWSYFFDQLQPDV